MNETIPPSNSTSARTMTTAGRWERLLTPDTKIAVGAWLLCMTGVLAFLHPSDLPASVAFRVTLALAGFALYGIGHTEKSRERLIKAGATGAELYNGLSRSEERR